MISQLLPVSEDPRRSLSEFGVGGTWKVGKLVRCKSDCVIGKHLHKLKDEVFLIIKGKVVIELNEEVRAVNVAAHDRPVVVEVPRNTWHCFHCTKGTVILGLGSELHDSADDNA